MSKHLESTDLVLVRLFEEVVIELDLDFLIGGRSNGFAHGVVQPPGNYDSVQPLVDFEQKM